MAESLPDMSGRRTGGRASAARILGALVCAGLVAAVPLRAWGAAEVGGPAQRLSFSQGVSAAFTFVRQEAAGRQVVRVTLEHASDAYDIEAVIRADSAARAVDAARATLRWEGAYLLVGGRRGGAGARGAVDLVFLLERGRLRPVGEAEAGSYAAGGFRDVYDKFEQNKLTSPAGAPVFRLWLDVRDGRLRANLPGTWRESERRTDENAATIRDVMRRVAAPLSSADLVELTDALAFNAVLARYTQRPDELEESIRAAGAALGEADLRLLEDLVARVIPGELPRPAAKVTYRRRP